MKHKLLFAVNESAKLIQTVLYFQHPQQLLTPLMLYNVIYKTMPMKSGRVTTIRLHREGEGEEEEKKEVEGEKEEHRGKWRAMEGSDSSDST